VARPDPFAQRPRRGVLRRALLDDERIVTAAHQHWAKVAEPVAFVVAGLVLVLAIDSFLPASASALANVFWWAWFFLVGRAIWKVVEWRHDWFAATDKRLILTYGLTTQKVAMMPLAKVTDMSYNRSPLGRLLGYGTFVLESAGQDQALHRVGWVADPDRTYRAICAEMFGIDNQARKLAENEYDHRFRSGPPSAPPGGPDTTDHSTAIRIRPAGSQAGTSDPGASDSHEPDIEPERDDPERDPRIREAETGPIPYWSPECD
jgi:membrane protein YdbS with pleckstrin-like domain